MELKWRARLSKQADSEEMAEMREELAVVKAELAEANDTIDRMTDVLVSHGRERARKGDPLAKMVA